MPSEPSIELEVSSDFKRNLRALAKRYRHIRSDLEPLLAQLQAGDCPGDQISGIAYTVFKVRLKNSPELGRLPAKPLASLCGLAPMNRDSGQMRGKRQIVGGRAAVRTALYMATLVATQHNPVIREFYQHLLQRGKPKKVALMAAMRKLLTLLNAMVAHDTLWQAPACALPPSATPVVATT